MEFLPFSSAGIAQLNWGLLTFERPNNVHIKCLIGLICQDLKAGPLARDIYYPSQCMGKMRNCYLIFMTMALRNKYFNLFLFNSYGWVKHWFIFFQKRQEVGGGYGQIKENRESEREREREKDTDLAAV